MARQRPADLRRPLFIEDVAGEDVAGEDVAGEDLAGEDLADQTMIGE